MPGLAPGLNHERRHDRMARKPLLDLRDFAEIGFDRAITDQLDIIEPDHSLMLVVDRSISRCGVDDRLANGLPDGAAPSCLKGLHDLIPGVGRRTRGEPKWIRRSDSAEIDAEIRHGPPLCGAI